MARMVDDHDDRDVAPPSFDDLEPEGGIEGFPVPSGNMALGDATDDTLGQLSYIEEDYLEDDNDVATATVTSKPHQRPQVAQKPLPRQTTPKRSRSKPYANTLAAPWLQESDELTGLLQQQALEQPQLAAGLIAATIPLMLHMHPHVYRALVPLSPQLIGIAMKHKGDPHITQRLKQTVNRLAARAAKGASVSPAIIQQIFKDVSRQQVRT